MHKNIKTVGIKPYVVDKYGILLTNSEKKELRVHPRFIA
jgi:hypothetical protein